MSAFDDASMEEQFPPVPAWRPTIVQPIERIVDRIRYYTNGGRDFAVLEHGTVVILEDGLSDEDARRHAGDVLHAIFNYHPDMNPLRMDDGNVLVQYNHPAVNVVLQDVVERHWAEIDERHQDALATRCSSPAGPEPVRRIRQEGAVRPVLHVHGRPETQRRPHRAQGRLIVRSTRSRIRIAACRPPSPTIRSSTASPRPSMTAS